MRLISTGEDRVLYCEACESAFGTGADAAPLGVCPVCGAAPAAKAVRAVAPEAVDTEHEGNAT